jgi:hypothetical protein
MLPGGAAAVMVGLDVILSRSSAVAASSRIQRGLGRPEKMFRVTIADIKASFYIEVVTATPDSFHVSHGGAIAMGRAKEKSRRSLAGFRVGA